MSTNKSELSFFLGNRLREERSRIRKTQEEMAVELDLSVRTWGKYERGETVPDAVMLVKLQSLGMDISYIVTGTKLAIDGEEERILEQYRKADGSIKFVIKSILETLK